ncbi:Histone-lysine N-methyltransferase SUVR4, partial [Dichanthelium oligosanthes]
RMAAPDASTKRFDDAVKSMTKIGLPKETVVRVLEKLLILYDDNWEHIEADNYNTLADAICDAQSPKEGQKKRAEKKNLDSDHCNKKLKIKEPSCHGSGKRESAEMQRQPKAEANEGKTIGTQLQKGSSQIVIKEPKVEASLAETTTIGENSSALVLKSQEYHTFETPLAVMRPKVLGLSHRNGHEDAHLISDVLHAADKLKGVLVAHEGQMANACSSQAIVRSKDFSTNFEVPLSSSGNGKLSFSFNSSLANSSDFHMPDIESVCKAMEARCLKMYKILGPNFSFMKLLDDTCQCILDLGSGSNEAKERSILQISPAMDFLSKPSLQSNQSSSSRMPLNNRTRLGGSAVSSGGCQNNSSNMQVIQYQSPSSVKRPYHDINDITKGEERVSIPIVNAVEDGVLPPPFHYIPHNTTLQEAYINLSLARIGDENCCSDCLGDCLAEPLPCACATETGGEFAYTRDGLLTEEFLDACISMRREPLKHPHSYCKICPIERMKMDSAKPDACKGHSIQKFIKECWRKCGCTRNCGNRVVQRGITRNLQASEVFLTPGKKGWGLRPAEKLPRGAFVCEYVGEILTNTELYERNNQKTGKAKHTYPVLLNADWGTEGLLKDEEALCLDGTFYGNVARFINHRCFDSNIIDIPVEIETPDHHYYHVAFFTTREVEAFEELTWVGGKKMWNDQFIPSMLNLFSSIRALWWPLHDFRPMINAYFYRIIAATVLFGGVFLRKCLDYGIDFDDVNHPVKAFKCQCGSGFCRDKSRISSFQRRRAGRNILGKAGLPLRLTSHIKSTAGYHSLHHTLASLLSFEAFAAISLDSVAWCPKRQRSNFFANPSLTLSRRITGGRVPSLVWMGDCMPRLFLKPEPSAFSLLPSRFKTLYHIKTPSHLSAREF